MKAQKSGVSVVKDLETSVDMSGLSLRNSETPVASTGRAQTLSNLSSVSNPQEMSTFLGTAVGASSGAIQIPEKTSDAVSPLLSPGVSYPYTSATGHIFKPLPPYAFFPDPGGRMYPESEVPEENSNTHGSPLSREASLFQINTEDPASPTPALKEMPVPAELSTSPTLDGDLVVPLEAA